MDKCGDKGLTFLVQKDIIREVLIKSGMQIAQIDFSSGGCRPQDCMKMTQEADRGADRKTGKYASKMRDTIYSVLSKENNSRK